VTEVRAGERVELRIASLAATGDGVARHAGRVIFVARTAPGDRVVAEVSRVRRRHAHADLLRVLEPGPGRRDPPCPLADRCGGCDWMHLEERVQSEARRRTVEETLRRIGGMDSLPEIREIESPDALGYRARARVACEGGRVGFRGARSHEVVDVRRCAVLDAPTQAALDRLRADPPSGPREIELRGFDTEVTVSPHRYRVSPGSFFQASRPLWRTWRDAVLEACGGGGLVVELYAGVGFYTVGLEERFERVIAVERSRAARDLARNAPRAEVVHAPAERFADLTLGGLEPEVALVNPPREGCDPIVVDAIARAPRVVYVSCEVATLARDLARLTRTHRPTTLVVLHALPQTSRIEVILVVERVDTSSE